MSQSHDTREYIWADTASPTVPLSPARAALSPLICVEIIYAHNPHIASVLGPVCLQVYRFLRQQQSRVFSCCTVHPLRQPKRIYIHRENNLRTRNQRTAILDRARRGDYPVIRVWPEPRPLELRHTGGSSKWNGRFPRRLSSRGGYKVGWNLEFH